MYGTWLGEGYWLAGDCERVKQTLEECLELAERCGIKCYTGRPHRLLGEIALGSDPAQALLHLDKSIEVLCGIKAANELALAYAGYGRLH